MTRPTRWAALLVATGAAVACSRGPQRAVSPAEVRAVAAPALPTTPEDAAWSRAPVHPAALMPQDVVEPTVLAPTTPMVDVQAMTDGARIAFRLTWAAPARSDRTLPAVFSDACAVQVPGSAGAEVPNPVMGEAGRPVEISYWRAAWQASVDGRPDSLAALHPNAKVDHYPFESPSLVEGSAEQLAMARRYAPARALGNAMAGPRASAVEDLVASGPGTLRSAARPLSSGTGAATASGWSVVFVRPLPTGVKPGGRSVVAFAIWRGDAGEAGARKMRSGWIPLAVEAP
jgi:hypothetical protein